MTFQKGIVTAIATGTLFLSSLTPMALADSSIIESGNGAVSQNDVSANTSNTTKASQNNTADITNNVTSSAETGGNDASFNTGGSTVISTGNASTNTHVNTAANANIADLGSGCTTCSTTGTRTVDVTGNGAFSTNQVTADNKNKASLTQNNDATINNRVKSEAETGDNSASFNTGGDTTILTGDAATNTSITNHANANIASLGGIGSGNQRGSAFIAGNGAASNNDIALNDTNRATLNQNNRANINNWVDASSETGNNTASLNTGGSVLVGTGTARTNTAIDNLANFNAADLATCGCVTDNNGHVALFGNGAFSRNNVTDNLKNNLATRQDNAGQVGNWLTPEAQTGDNNSGLNTSDNGGSSFLFTGDSRNTTHLKTATNVNDLGNGLGFNLGGTDVHVLFDMNNLFNQLHL